MDYNDFRSEYENQHPASIPFYEEPLSDNPRWMTYAILAMFVCSAALSGVHTVPTAYGTIEAAKVAEFVRQPVALGAFIFIELGILITSYSMFKKWSWIAFLILALCIIIAMAANLYSVNKAMQTNDMGAMIVGVAFGIAAPLIAMMSGKQYVNVHRSEQVALFRAKQQYHESKIAHDKRVAEAWEQLQIKLEARQEKINERERIRIEREAEQIHSLHSLNSVNEQVRLPYSANSSTGYSKRMDAKLIIREYLTNHPDMMVVKLDDLVKSIEAESGIKVGRTSVHNVRSEMQNQSNDN